MWYLNLLLSLSFSLSKEELLESGIRHYRQKDYQRAKISFSLILTEEPECIDSHLRLAHTFKQLRNHRKALYHFRQAETLGKMKPLSTQQKQMLLSVVPHCELYIRLAQQSTDKGTEYIQQGSMFKAKNEFENAINLDPECAEAYFHLGILEADTSGDMDKARDLLNRAIEADEKFSDAYFAIAWLLEYHFGEVETAYKLYDRGLSHVSDDLKEKISKETKDLMNPQRSKIEQWSADDQTF